jgi:hypothetical protein
MFRAFCTWPVIWPKLVGLVISRPGGPQLAWLNALKKLGARSTPTPALPSEPTAGTPNAQEPLSTPAAQKLAAVTGPKNWSTVCDVIWYGR